MTEHSIQTKVVQYIRTFYPEVLICSIPNGSGTSASNRLHLYQEGLLAGMPDLFIAEARWFQMHQSRYHLLPPHQKDFQDDPGYYPG